MDLLKEAALHFQSLFETQYHITYGKQKKLHSVRIRFSLEEFFHLAGFQYLKDVKIPRIKGKDLFQKILDGRITEQDIAKSKHYEAKIKGRLEMLCHLQEFLEDENILFYYNPKRVPGYSKIKADYLISSRENTEFAFFIRERQGEYLVCLSVFQRRNLDYTINQCKCAVLKKTKIDLVNQSETVLLDKLNKGE